MENEKLSYFGRLKSFTIQCKRVWQVLRKPTGEEFKAIAKVSALGILVLGAIGFAISDILKLIGNFFI